MRATLMLASNMNSSTSELVSSCSFCSTSMGPVVSDEFRWILSSGDDSDSAPAAKRLAFRLMASEFSNRIDSVKGSFKDLGELVQSGSG